MNYIDFLQRLVTTVAFGNGWLALGALGAVVILTMLVRLLPGIRI